MRLIDNGERINLISDDKITPHIIHENKIIKQNLIAIQRTEIIQIIRNINKKYNRKLSKIEHQQVMRKISNKINRRLTPDERDLINERLIGGHKKADRNKSFVNKAGIKYIYKEGIGMVRDMESLK